MDGLPLDGRLPILGQEPPPRRTVIVLPDGSTVDQRSGLAVPPSPQLPGGGIVTGDAGAVALFATLFAAIAVVQQQITELGARLEAAGVLAPAPPPASPRDPAV